MTGELSALLDGAAMLRRAGNRAAAIAALLSAVALAPDDRTAHRRLAAAYAVAGDHDSARAEYARFISRLEARGSFDAAVLERAYATALFAPAPRALVLPAAVTSQTRHRDEHRASSPLTHARSAALWRVAVAALAIAATFGAMFIAGAQIFASGGPP